MKYVYLLCLFFWINLSIGLSQTESQLAHWSALIEKQIDSTAYERHLKVLAQAPHRAGTDANKKVAEYISQVMESAGLEVTSYPYDIFMPKGPGSASARIITPHRIPLSNQEDILKEDPYSQHPDLDIGWNAYSGTDTVTGHIVYVNYGRKEDYERLKELGISLRGKIALARYGGNFRGFKAKFAEAYGAIGLIMYSDPKDVGYVRGLPFPEGRFYNSSTIQRGSVLTLPYTGDPLTPFEPALPLDDPQTPKRLPVDSVDFHTIPVLPLSYGSAEKIMQYMTGPAVPPDWQGGLPFTYRITGGDELRVEVAVHQPKDFVRIENVIGQLKGTEKPDEWIILGCHYDAWGYGSTDPNSGTAMLLTLAETLGRLKKAGHSIHRSILIGHWDAEEYGILGSAEWVEHLKEKLSAQTIAYLNADAACSGLRFSAAAAPSLKPLILSSAKYTRYWTTDTDLYTHWQQNQKKSKDEFPNIGHLGGGSDHLGFYAHLGIPSMAASISSSTLYHSNYDDLYWYEKFGDSTYQNGITLAKFFSHLCFQLGNHPILPYSLEQYGIDLNIHLSHLQNLWPEQSTAFDTLHVLAEEIKNIGQTTDLNLQKIETDHSGINTLLLQTERQFLRAEGMPFGAWYRSSYACSDPYSGYSSWLLPGLRYAVENKDNDLLLSEINHYLKTLQKLKHHIHKINQLTNY